MAACSGELDTGAQAERTWREACHSLGVPNDGASAWDNITRSNPPDSIWHSLSNCVGYQAGIWQNLLEKGINDVTHPVAFKMAIVLRHTPSNVAAEVLSEVLKGHKQAQELTSYILALLVDDDSSSQPSMDSNASSTASFPPAPLRDLQLFGDCELAVLAASEEEYDNHAKLVRMEYSKLANENYGELRIKVLNQLSQIPQLYHTPEFGTLETAAKGNIDREINTLKKQLNNK